MELMKFHTFSLPAGITRNNSVSDGLSLSKVLVLMCRATKKLTTTEGCKLHASHHPGMSLPLNQQLVIHSGSMVAFRSAERVSIDIASRWHKHLTGSSTTNIQRTFNESVTHQHALKRQVVNQVTGAIGHDQSSKLYRREMTSFGTLSTERKATIADAFGLPFRLRPT
jgi:hypothetical protein